MSSPSPLISQWDNEYARLARSASQLRTTGLSTSSDDMQSLKNGLQSLEMNLNNLNGILSASEIQRRRRLIQHLQTTNVEVTNNTTIQQSQMKTALQQQDTMIDQLASGMSRLKQQTMNIGEEANLQNHLMETMETGLDQAAVGLLEETRRAAALREDQSIWRLQLIVAGLSVLLVLLIFLGLSP